MPYSIDDDNAECADDEVAVVKDSDGEVMGCHASEEDAQDQIAALEASEDERGEGLPLRAFAYYAGEGWADRLPDAGVETRIDVMEMLEEVSGRFWRRFDEMPDEDYLVPEVHLVTASETEASGWLVAKNRATDRYWRAGWTYMDGGTGAAEIEYDEKDDWTEVQEQWVPVDGDAEEMEEEAAERKASAQEETGTEDEEQRAPDVHDGLEERGPQLGQYQRRTYNADVRRSSDGQSTTVIINTDAVDGHGTIVDPSGMRLQHGNRRFSRNFFINHDMNLLAGESPEPQYRGDALQVQVSDDAWDHEDELVERWYRKVKKGLLTQASIGFMPIDGEYTERNGERVYRYTDWMLREWSFVPIASNPEADVTSRTPASRLEKRLKQIEKTLSQVAPEAPDSSEDTSRSTPDAASADQDPEGKGRQGESRGSQATDDGTDSGASGSTEPTRVLTVQHAKRLLRERDRKRKQKAEEIAKRKLGMA